MNKKDTINRTLLMGSITLGLLSITTATAFASDTIHKCKNTYSNVDEYRNAECERDSQKAQLKLPPITKYQSDRIFENTGVSEEELLEKDESEMQGSSIESTVQTKTVKEGSALLASQDKSLDQLIEKTDYFYKRYANGFMSPPAKSEAMELQAKLSSKCLNLRPSDGINEKERCQKAIHKLKEVVHE